MSSKSPQVIRHFIPLQFSKEALDYKNAPTRSYVKVQQNPLQNMKLKASQRQNDSNFTLIFKNKSNKQFTSKFKVNSSRLLKQMQLQSQKCSFIKQQIMIQQVKMQLKTKPFSKHSTRASSVAKPKTPRFDIKHQENRQLKSSQNQIISRRIFSCKSFRKFTSVSSAKHLKNLISNQDWPQFQQIQHKLKIKGSKKYIDYF